MHVEPGKGRKAIILSGRVRAMPALSWEDVRLVSPPSSSSPPPSTSPAEGRETDDVWALLSASGTFLFVGSSVKAVLGWGPGEVMGKPVLELLPSYAKDDLRRALRTQKMNGATLDFQCDMIRKDSAVVRVRMVIFGSGKGQMADTDAARTRQASSSTGFANMPQLAAKPMICLVRLASPSPAPFSGTHPSPLISGIYSSQPSSATSIRSGGPSVSIFDELDPKKSASWQYELQQLKYANQRLQQDVVDLEGKLSTATSPSPMQAEGGRVGATGEAESGLGVHVRMMTSNVLKRSWDAGD